MEDLSAARSGPAPGSRPRLGTLLLGAAMALLAWGCRDDPAALGPVAIDLVERYAAAARPGDGGERVPQADVEGGRLLIPYGGQADIHLRQPPGARLALDGIESDGGWGSHLSVVLRTVGGAESELARLRGSRGPRVVELPRPGEIVRLSLRARGNAKTAGAGLTLLAPRVHWTPGAPEVSADDAGGAAAPGAKPPNVIVYLVDTLRPDVLGPYGFPEPVTPELDRFAAEATTYELAVAQSPWTRASVATLFTGLDPRRHGVNDRYDALAEEALTITELLTAAGYTTVGFITNGNTGRQFGFEQGFFKFTHPRFSEHGSEFMNERVFGYFAHEPPPEPFFLFVHTMDPHHPYAPPSPFLEQFGADPAALEVGSSEVLTQFRRDERQVTEADRAQIAALYAGEVARNDHHFGRFLEFFRSTGRYDNSLIIFNSDHGEEFWEHDNWGHGHTLYGEVLAMPLVVKAPHQKEPRRESRLVQHIDLAPTILDYAGIEPPASMQGTSLRRLGSRPAGSAYSVLDLDERVGVSVTVPEWKLIVPRWGPSQGRSLVFDLVADPGETMPLPNPDPVVLGYLETELALHERDLGDRLEPDTATMDEDLVRDLKAIGYLQ